jgi:hypothetical protein
MTDYRRLIAMNGLSGEEAIPNDAYPARYCRGLPGCAAHTTRLAPGGEVVANLICHFTFTGHGIYNSV